MKRNATAVWNGSGKDGNGHLTTQSTVLNQTQYSFNSRFADGVGTNPEELVAAAHAGCYTMSLSFGLNKAGFTAESLETTALINFENGTITGSHLVVKAKVAGIDQSALEVIAKESEQTCPVSRALSVEISSEILLVE
ncbi:OsmC family protein [Dyadobacter psychrotolerans]|uniref:OsmC family peroxiredoxin n=1 Tax=Dyadobacter psychrotolerans TaxID=2541721 RepID=A0A4R5DAW9_9BACT|nr:OsmC family protein [Dyadobacter psychrotolerans]TDE10769.1 OsmC family peroxiredoxin [Dyadobacter psychrotolerans]